MLTYGSVREDHSVCTRIHGTCWDRNDYDHARSLIITAYINDAVTMIII